MSSRRFGLILMVSLLFAAPTFGIWGTLDKVPGSTVVLPFFEVGINSAQNPHDTLPTIYNTGGALIVHWEVYDIDGTAVFWDSRPIGGVATWAFSMRGLINTHASSGDLARLTHGDFYRGFMTIDVVTAATVDPPFDTGYPFANNNSLLGNVYYLRLAQGSANGLTLPTLEYTADSGVHARLNGFYGDHDNLEEMDIRARLCAQSVMEGDSCAAVVDETPTIYSRVFRSNAINGKTRIIVFAWDTSQPDAGGPSVICDVDPSCISEYGFGRLREDGVLVELDTLRLDHVVNVIEVDAGPANPGNHVLFGPEDPSSSLQLFAFSVNSAQPAGNPNTNWDAIFESSIVP